MEPGRAKEFLATINSEVDRLTHLVHNLLDMSRIEAGALDPHLTETTVAEVIGPVVRRARAASRQRVDVDVPETLPPVLVDPVRLDQVLTNLLDNARGYAAGGPVQVVARQAGADVELRVIDPAPASRARSGTRYSTVLPAQGRRQAAQGTGMGLSHLPWDGWRRSAAACAWRPRRAGGAAFAPTLPGGPAARQPRRNRRRPA